MSLFAELKRRNVIRVAAAYVVIAWLIIQVVETIFPAFGFGDAAVRFVVIALAIGFVPVLIASWAFELTPQGLKRDADVDAGVTDTKKLDRIIMLVLALALGFFAFDTFVLDPARDAEMVEEAAEQARSEALLGSYGDKSIAVLAFRDMSPDGDQQYLSEGIAEELLNLLARIPELRVISRSSAFSYIGKDIDVPTIAEQLDVVHVLEGSVRKAGNRIRITAQLIEGATDTHLWSETYDRELDDIFAIQDEISAQVVEQLKIVLLDPRPSARATDPEAYRLYLQAVYLLGKTYNNKEYDLEAVSLFRQAVQLDPEFGAAWRELSRALSRLAETDAQLQAVHDALERAIALDPTDAAALSYKAWWVASDGDIESGVAMAEQALSMEPANEHVVRAMMFLVRAFGSSDDAVALGEYGVKHNPLCGVCNEMLARVYRDAGRLDDAANFVRSFTDMHTGSAVVLGEILLLKGQPQAALELFEKADDDGHSLYYQALALHDLGRLDESASVMNTYIASEWAAKDPMGTAGVYAWLGETETAFEILEATANSDLPSSLSVALRSRHPFYASLRDDSRWQTFLARRDVSAEQLESLRFVVTLPDAGHQ